MKSRQPISLSSSSPTAFLFSCFIIFFITTTISASSDGNTTDYEALLQFKSVITNDPHEALSSWNSSFHHCDWSGVSCGNRHKRVTALKLNSQGLEGSLSPYVGNLSFLREFFLYNNSFQGTIPHELGRLSRLRLLQLSHNKFKGVIPTNLSRCSKLIKLGLQDNKLVGSIPHEISFLSKLTYIAIDENKLTGGIPPVLGNITSMEVFSATRNPLGGSIPDTLGRWKNLTEVYLGVCNLTGTIPHFFYNLSLLTNFSLTENQLIGSTLPSSKGAMLPHLESLQLDYNQLTGHLPPWISNCTKLEFLAVSHNHFMRKMTIDFSKLKDIRRIYLDDYTYGLGEADDMKSIDTLKNCSKLEVLSLHNCKFQGVVPASIGNISDQINLLVLRGNYLYGHLPSSIGNLVGLTRLDLSRNRFTGDIPSTIGKLQKLQVAYLFDNQLSGPIPDTVGNLSVRKMFLYVTITEIRRTVFMLSNKYYQLFQD